MFYTIKSKRNLIYSIIFLIIFLSLYGFNITQINTVTEVKEEQNDIDINIISVPKLSAYDVSEKWNKTTGGYVKSVAVSADGKYMVVGTDIDAAGDELFFFNTSGHDGIPMWSVNTVDNINEVAISGTGKYIAVAGDNYALLFNSTPSAGNIPMWNVTANADSGYSSVDISANGEYIVLGHRYQTGNPQTSEVYLYNNSYSVNKVEMWYQEINNRIYSVTITPDGNYIAVGAEFGLTGPGSEGQITAINNTDPTSVPSSPTKFWMWWDAIYRDIYSVAISDDGKYVTACGQYDNTPSPTNMEEIYFYHNFEFVGNQYGGLNPEYQHIPAWGYNTTFDMKTIAISADGSKLAAGGNWHATDDNLLYFNNTPSVGNLPEWSYKADESISSVDMTADGSYVVAGLIDIIGDTIVFFNNSGVGTKTPEWSLSYSSSLSPFLSVSISSWGNYIGAGGGPGGFGKAFLFYHARPIPRIISGNGGGDDDDDDDEEGAIPFGNHYLLFAAIAIASLIIITKRKAVFSKK